MNDVTESGQDTEYVIRIVDRNVKHWQSEIGIGVQGPRWLREKNRMNEYRSIDAFVKH